MTTDKTEVIVGVDSLSNPELLAKIQEAMQNMPNQPNHTAGEHLPYGSLFGLDRGFNFLDANIGFLDFGTNDTELEAVQKLAAMTRKGCNAKSDISLEEIASQILKDETQFDLSKYNLSVSTTGARGAIISVLNQIVTPQKPCVMYASPNWVFDAVVGSVKNARIAETFIPTAENFVDTFEFVSSKVPLGAVILVDPANPLGYRFTKEQIERIERTSQKYGIVPIFDDVFRGLQAKGERHSSSEYSHCSVIVETTSKRFGARGLGVTWTLTPKELNLTPSVKEESCTGCSSLAAVVTQALYETGYGERIQSFLTANAAAFKQGFYDSFQETQPIGRFVHAFPAMPIMTYHFEEVDEELTASLVNDLETARGIKLTSGFEWICQVETKEKAIRDGKITQLIQMEGAFASSYIRICPTKETPDRCYIAGHHLGTKMQELVKK